MKYSCLNGSTVFLETLYHHQIENMIHQPLLKGMSRNYILCIFYVALMNWHILVVGWIMLHLFGFQLHCKQTILLSHVYEKSHRSAYQTGLSSQFNSPAVQLMAKYLTHWGIAIVRAIPWNYQLSAMTSIPLTQEEPNTTRKYLCIHLGVPGK